MTRVSIRAFAPLFFSAALLTACSNDNSGGSGGSSSSSSSSGSAVVSLPVSGSVVAAPVGGATVTAFLTGANGAPGGTALGTATTAADGSFSLTVTLPAGTAPPVDLSLVATGGNYTSEANTATTVTNASTGVNLSVTLAGVGASGLSGVVVSPLTTIVASRTQGLIAGVTAAAGNGPQHAKAAACATVDACLPAADAGIQSAYGLSGGTPSSSLVPNFTASSGDGATFALVLGSFEQEALAQGQPPLALVDAVSSDFFDGVPNGAGPGGGPVSFPNTTITIPPALGSDLFLSSMTTYVSNSTSPPAGTTTASNGVNLNPVSSAVRAGISSVAPPSSGLEISSSGAVSEIVDPASGHQVLLVAARAFGLQGLDINNPTAPTQISFATLNAALAALNSGASLPSVDAVTAIPGLSDAEAVLTSFNSTHVVLVDLDKQTVLNDSDMNAGLASPLTQTSFSGGEAFISSSNYDPNIGVAAGNSGGGVWLATAAGYVPYVVATHAPGTPIPLDSTSAVQFPAENLGGATTDGAGPFSPGLLLSGNYGPQGSGGGLELVNIGTAQTAFALSDNDFQTLFGVNFEGAAEPFGIVDGNSVDANLNVGIITGEDTPYMGFVDLHNPAAFSFTGTAAAGSFTVKSTTATLTQTLSDDTDSPTLSGTAVEATNHLVLGIAAFSQTLLVGQLDNPAAPANGKTWAGLSGWRFYNASSAEYNSTAADPHAVGALLATANSKSYGVTLSINGDGTETVLLIDLAAFLAAPAVAAPTGDTGPEHALAATPFGTPVIQTFALTNTFSPAAALRAQKERVKVRRLQPMYGMQHSR